MKTVHEQAASYGRSLDYGRNHMIVRETEAEAREYADELVSKLDEDKGKAIENVRLIQHPWVWPARREIVSLLIWKDL